MEKYYVSGCKDNGIETVTCDDNEAQFWTLYERDDAGLSQGIIDCVFREDAAAAMAAYVERDALQEQVRALAALAEERREFIVNGAELGYIQLPVFDDDPATATYQRCLLKPKFAADAALREIGAKAGKFCDKAPAGYQCTRLAGHDGPCAAVDTNREGQP